MNEKKDSELLFYALHNWANYVETGEVTMSAKDAQNAKHPFNALSREQMAMVLRLRDLADAHLAGKAPPVPAVPALGKTVEKNSQLEYYALSNWANYIETGDVAMSAQDAQNCKRAFNALGHDQMTFVLRLRNLAAVHLTGKAPQLLAALPQASLADEADLRKGWVGDQHGVQTYKVGKIRFGTVHRAMHSPKDAATQYQANFLLVGIKPDLGLFASENEAMGQIERAATGWLKALQE
jgi:hypothetical protein